MFEHPEFDDHELVAFCRDAETGLTAIIAIHNTRLGPAAGGCRMWPYASTKEALTDVLRLSRAMTFKNALAGLPLGGGKSVIIGDAGRDKTPALLAAFARSVNSLGGRYHTAEDVGIGLADAEILARHSSYVFGLDKGGSGSGDPSAYTARGGYQGIRAAVRHRLGRTDLAGLRVAVQGVGNVGYELCRLLHDDGARLWVADPSDKATQRAHKEFDASVVSPESIFDQDVDVFSPCALGGVITENTIPRLRARVIAGLANNQLGRPEDGQALWSRGILYAPDFIVNSGGMHNAARDIIGDYGREVVLQRIDAIYELTLELFNRADKQNLAPEVVAEQMAREKLQAPVAA